MKEHITDREIIVLTEDNYRDYVVFPEYIQKKIDNGVITRTHMSDLLRTELLLQYGGTWIDATVMITGSLPGYMLDSDLFFYQCLKPGLDGHPTKMSNWFISAEKNNRILRLTIELLYNYWKNIISLLTILFIMILLNLRLKNIRMNGILLYLSAVQHHIFYY